MEGEKEISRICSLRAHAHTQICEPASDLFNNDMKYII